MRTNRFYAVMSLIILGGLLIIFKNLELSNHEYINSARKILLIALFGLTISDIFSNKEREESGDFRYILGFLFSVLTFFIIWKTGYMLNPLIILIVFAFVNMLKIKK